MATIITRVSGVTFEDRQDVIARLLGDEIVVLSAEPDNIHDPHAIAVWVLLDDGENQLGYIPLNVTHIIEPFLSSPETVASIRSITGGFEKPDGTRASYGILLQIETPQDRDDEIPF